MLTSIGCFFLQEAGSGDQCLPHASQSVHLRTLCSPGWQCAHSRTQVSQWSDSRQCFGECAAACVAWLHKASIVSTMRELMRCFLSADWRWIFTPALMTAFLSLMFLLRGMSEKMSHYRYRSPINASWSLLCMQIGSWTVRTSHSPESTVTCVASSCLMPAYCVFLTHKAHVQTQSSCRYLLHVNVLCL